MDTVGRRGLTLRLSPLGTIYGVYAALSLLNFFLTANPYSAGHNGRVGLESSQFGTEFRFHVPTLIAISIIAGHVISWVRGLIIHEIYVILIMLIPISGAINGALFLHPFSYALDVLAFGVIASLAKWYARFNNATLPPFMIRIAGLFFVFGPILAVIKPQVWGFLPFGFSRASRGEISLWHVSGIMAIIPCLLAARLTSFQGQQMGNKKLLFAWCVIALLELSTASRTYIIFIFSPILIWTVLFSSGKSKLILLMIGLGAAMSAEPYIESLIHPETGVINSSQDPLEQSLNGRWALWTYYAGKFNEAPWFGSGAFMLNRVSDYDEAATSEIGLLKTFVEYGLLWGAVQLFTVMAAIFLALRTLVRLRSSVNVVTAFCCYIILTYSPNFFLQGMTRIFSIADLLFWFSCFFMISVDKPWAYKKPSRLNEWRLQQVS